MAAMSMVSGCTGWWTDCSDEEVFCTLPKSLMHPPTVKLFVACTLIDALKNPILPQFDSSPEAKHHCPAEGVEQRHEGGDGHDKRVHIVQAN